MLIRLCLLLIAVSLGAFVSSQIIIPAITGRTFFPLFRKKHRELKNELAEATRLEYEASLEKKTADKKVKAARIKVATNINTNQVYDDLIDDSENLYNTRKENK